MEITIYSASQKIVNRVYECNMFGKFDTVTTRVYDINAYNIRIGNVISIQQKLERIIIIISDESNNIFTLCIEKDEFRCIEIS